MDKTKSNDKRRMFRDISKQAVSDSVPKSVIFAFFD
jgi:hypothetical protein